MRVKWIGPHLLAGGGERFRGEEYDMDDNLAHEFIGRGLAAPVGPAKPAAKVESVETDEE